MSLFDDNYVSVMEKANPNPEAEDDTKKKDDAPAEGEAPADKDTKKKDDAPAEGEAPAEGAEECGPECETDKSDPETVNPDASTEAAVDMDIEADSIEESYGFDMYIGDEVQESLYACTEAVAMNTAFDRVDIACTEAYLAAGTAYEKDIVTEKFSESVKKYAAKFRAFLSKIKNLIIRIFNKAVNYIKILAARVVAKFSSLRSIEGKTIKADVKVKVHQFLLKKGFDDFKKAIVAKDEGNMVGVYAIFKDAEKFGKTADQMKASLEKIKPTEKSELVKAVYGDSKEEEYLLTGKESEVKGYANQLKQAEITKCVKKIDEFKKEMDRTIADAEKLGKTVSDIDTAKITLVSSGINKAMTIYNRRVSAMVTLLLAWINARAKIVRAAGWNSEKATAVKASAFSDASGVLFDKYFEAI